jgi:purine-nucleoside phosphorylase
MMKNKLVISREYCKKQIKDFVPTIGIVLGSGLGSFVNEINTYKTINYESIPDFPTCTVHGHNGKFILGTVEDKKVICMQGRFHLYEGYSIQEVVLPIWLMHSIGINTLIISNAAGGINRDFSPGDLMIINDHINFQFENPFIGNPLKTDKVHFFDMTEAYNKRFIKTMHEVAGEMEINLREGVYASVKGPNYETPAEVRMLRTLGADAVGMSTVPEVLCARQAGIELMAISCITNMATGISENMLSHEEVLETTKKMENVFPKLISKFINAI